MKTEEPLAREITCFVIGPIGDKDAEAGSSARTTYEEGIQVFEEVIEPACLAFGVKATRADQISTTGEIPEQVFRRLRDSHLVIADLTGANANVMYELGLRHTTGKLTIQIGERERLPFDIAAIRTILFRRTEGGLVEARRKLAATMATGLEGGGDPVSATRVWFETLDETDVVTPEELEDDEGDEEPGFLEKLADLSDGLDSLTINLEAITSVMNEINGLVADSASRVRQINAAGGSAGARLATANSLAATLNEPVSRFEVLIGDYRQTVARMHPGMVYALSIARESDDPSAVGFRNHVLQFVEGAAQTWPVLNSFKEVLKEGGEAARSVRRVNRRMISALDKYLESKATFMEWQTLAQGTGT